MISGDGRWKLHLPHKYGTLKEAGMDGQAGKYIVREIELSLFDMDKDPYETTNVLEKYPDVAAKLKAYAEQHQKTFYPK